MLRKMISLPFFAAAVCVAAHGFVNAECNSCNSAAGFAAGCPGGNCGGRLLGGLNHSPQTGPCMTCNNIWDDYCASKKRCLPQARYPFQDRACGGCGHCSSCCNNGVSVGIYGKCAAGGCAAPCDDACDAHGAIGTFGGGGGLIQKLFKRTPAASCCDDGCAANVSGGAHATTSQPMPMYSPAGQSQGVSAPAPVAPAKETTAPATPAVPAAPATPDSPSDLPGDLPSAGMTPQIPVPPAPAMTRVSRKGSTGAFSWLQNALGGR